LSPVKFANVDAARDAVQDYTSVAVNPSQPPVKTAAQTNQEPGSDVTQEEVALFNLVNQDRQSQGLSPLTLVPNLTEIARLHSRDMYLRRYFDHYAPLPGPVTPMDRYVAYIGHRPDYAMVGENIYYRSMTDVPDGTAEQSETAFMNSPPHRANILQPRFTKVGVGFFRSPDGQYWVTEMFLRDRP
jgi:uncharacterized protein YkwD